MTELSSGAAFFTLLDRCERRLERVRQLRRRERWLLATAVALALIAVLAGTTALTAAGEPGPAGWVVVSAAAALTALVTWFAADRPTRRRLAAEERHMIEDVNRLRGVLAYFARREEWDDARISSARQRLSAFPIGARGSKEAA